MLEKNTNKITRILIYVILEWTLIFLLLLNSLFSYLIHKFALNFRLKPPCFLCSRLDHVLDSKSSKKKSISSWKEFICNEHGIQLSNFQYCLRHNKLVESRNDVCDVCSVLKENGEGFVKKCCCCDDVIKGFTKNGDEKEEKHLEFYVDHDDYRLIPVKKGGNCEEKGKKCEKNEILERFCRDVELVFEADEVVVMGGGGKANLPSIQEDEEEEEEEEHSQVSEFVAEKSEGFVSVEVEKQLEVHLQGLEFDEEKREIEGLGGVALVEETEKQVEVHLQGLEIDEENSGIEGLGGVALAVEAEKQVEVHLQLLEIDEEKREIEELGVVTLVEETEKQVEEHLQVSGFVEEKREIEDLVVVQAKNQVEVHSQVSELGGVVLVEEAEKQVEVHSQVSEFVEEKREIEDLVATEAEKQLEVHSQVLAFTEEKRETEELGAVTLVEETEKQVEENSQVLEFVEEKREIDDLVAVKAEKKLEVHSQVLEIDEEKRKIEDLDAGVLVEETEQQVEEHSQVLEFVEEKREIDDLVAVKAEKQLEVHSQVLEIDEEKREIEDLDAGVLVEETEQQVEEHSQVLEFTQELVAAEVTTQAAEKQVEVHSQVLEFTQEIDEEKTEIENSSVLHKQDKSSVSDSASVLQEMIEDSREIDAETGVNSTSAESVNEEAIDTGIENNENVTQEVLIEVDDHPIACKNDSPSTDEDDADINKGSINMNVVCTSEHEGVDGGATLVEKLKIELESEKKTLRALYAELEEERNASAIAANQTMAMINRLQEEKASMQMEALQYQRMMEEQSEYDQEALQMMNELMVKREKEKQELEKEVEVYRKKLLDFEEREKVRILSRRMEGSASVRSRNSSASCSYGEESDGLSIDLNHDVKEQEEHEEENTPSDAFLGLQESLGGFENERMSILEQLKVLEEKLFSLADEEEEEENEDENGEEIDHENAWPNGSMQKRLLPLFDEVEFLESNEETDVNKSRSNKFELETKRVAIEKEVDHVYERLHALEADREFLKHCIGSLRKGDKGLDLLQEILQHLRDLKDVELHAIKNNMDPSTSI